MGNVSLKMVLLYADRCGAERGKDVAETLRGKLGPGFHIRQSSWNTELLRSTKLRALAALEARDSDLVMIALDEDKPLPEEVSQWFHLWKDRRRSTPAALVALLKRSPDSVPHSVEETLEAFARDAKMDFFCHSEIDRDRPRFQFSPTAAPAFAAAH